MGGTATKSSGVDKYSTFGLREEWLSAFFDQMDNWFDGYANLGPKQIPAMINWLREAELINAKDDPWWNPFVEQQAADRIYRIGQKNDVVIYKMIVEDSIEDKILSLQESKQKMFSDVLNGVSNEKIDLRELVDML